MRVIQISTATWPPWDRYRPCGRASAVLYGAVSVAPPLLLQEVVLRSVAHGVSSRGLVGDCESKFE